MTEPMLRRKFVLNNLDGNNNKVWTVELYPNGVQTIWGRVGGGTQSKMFMGEGQHFVDRKVAEKLDKGYREVQLNGAKPQVAAVGNSRPSDKLGAFIHDIFREAGEYIKSYLSVALDELSVDQIRRGQSILDEYLRLRSVPMSQKVSRNEEFELLQQYFNTIPTQLPARIDKYELADTFKPDEQQERLQQLEAALSTVQAPAGASLPDLGATLTELDRQTPQWKAIESYFNGTSNGARLVDIYEVLIPGERQAFEQEQFGAHAVSSLWHGTKGQNVRHILKTGFKVPNRYSNGWMFGAGIYLADKAMKSQNYSSCHILPQMLFLADAKLGTPYTALNAENFRAAPNGTHSVWGKAGYTNSYGSKLRNNEFIVYKPSQVTIRYIVTYR